MRSQPLQQNDERKPADHERQRFRVRPRRRKRPPLQQVEDLPPEVMSATLRQRAVLVADVQVRPERRQRADPNRQREPEDHPPTEHPRLFADVEHLHLVRHRRVAMAAVEAVEERQHRQIVPAESSRSGEINHHLSRVDPIDFVVRRSQRGADMAQRDGERDEEHVKPHHRPQRHPRREAEHEHRRDAYPRPDRQRAVADGLVGVVRSRRFKKRLPDADQVASRHPHGDDGDAHPCARRAVVEVQVLNAYSGGDYPFDARQPEEEPQRKAQIERDEVRQPRNRQVERDVRVAHRAPRSFGDVRVEADAAGKSRHNGEQVVHPVQDAHPAGDPEAEPQRLRLPKRPTRRHFDGQLR